MRVAEQLCAQLAFVGTERCKFSAHVRVALLEDVFTRLLPAPIGPSWLGAQQGPQPSYRVSEVKCPT